MKFITPPTNGKLSACSLTPSHGQETKDKACPSPSGHRVESCYNSKEKSSLRALPRGIKSALTSPPFVDGGANCDVCQFPVWMASPSSTQTKDSDIVVTMRHTDVYLLDRVIQICQTKSKDDPVTYNAGSCNLSFNFF